MAIMRFILPTQELQYLLNRLQGVVPNKPAAPVLGMLLMELSKGWLTLTAADITVGVRCRTEVKMLEEGTCAVPARRFIQLVRELSAPHLQITADERYLLEIVAGSSRFKIHGAAGGDFPKWPEVEAVERLQLPQLALKELLFRVTFAVAREDSRYVLTGVSFQIEPHQITVQGTDGKRLARAQLTLPHPVQAGNYVVPVKAVEELLGVLGEEGNASLSFSTDKLAVEVGDTLVVTKLLTGNYPDVSRVLPEGSEAIVSLHREELTTLLRQVSLFTNEANHSVKFTLNNGTLHLSANTADLGEGKVSMPANYSGPQREIAFNPGFVLDVLRHTKGETVAFAMTDPFNPGLFAEKEEALASPQQASPLFVVMPMRMQS